MTMTGLAPEKPAAAKPLSRLPWVSAWRTGVPVHTTCARFTRVALNVTHNVLRNGRERRLARPGERSDSWATTGIRSSHAATTVGNATKPPLENTTSGLRRHRMRKACSTPQGTRNASTALAREK